MLFVHFVAGYFGKKLFRCMVRRIVRSFGRIDGQVDRLQRGLYDPAMMGVDLHGIDNSQRILWSPAVTGSGVVSGCRAAASGGLRGW